MFDVLTYALPSVQIQAREYRRLKVLILTGPAGAGKNTIASIYANARERCAVIDVDVVRWMVLKPHVAPWGGEDGRRQHRLGVRNACMLARNFIEEGFEVVILDVLSDEIARLYEAALEPVSVNIVLLMPSFEEIQKRNRDRLGRSLTDEEIANCYESQTQLRTFDRKIDNTRLSPAEVAYMLN
jgi:adenylylsulfate kinase-like enzyme